MIEQETQETELGFTQYIVQSLKTELSGQLLGNNIRIIDSATVPKSPIKPKKRLALILALLGGFALGFGAAMLVEIIDQSIRTQEDVEEKLKLPYLGTIFFAKPFGTCLPIPS